MRLAVLDTNVLVSAAINAKGIPARIVDSVLERQAQTILCPEIEAEYRSVLTRKKFNRYGFPPLWLGRLLELSLHLEGLNPWPLDLPDPKDAPFLALAHASGAVLVTGNLKHFPKSRRNGVQVLSPAEYLERLTGGLTLR